MFYGAIMKFRIIGQSAQYTNASLKIFMQRTKLLILLLIYYSPSIRHGLTGQFQIIIRIFSINPVSIFLNHGKRELRWNKRPNFLAGSLSDAYSVEPQDTLCVAQNSVLCADMLSEATQKTLIQIRVINTEDAKPVFCYPCKTAMRYCCNWFLF